jgi:hypothetical protein
MEDSHQVFEDVIRDIRGKREHYLDLFCQAFLACHSNEMTDDELKNLFKNYGLQMIMDDGTNPLNVTYSLRLLQDFEKEK